MTTKLAEWASATISTSEEMTVKWVFGLAAGLIALGIYNASPVLAGKCGQVACRDITGEKSVGVIEQLMREARTDCKSVKKVRLLDKSKPGVMMIYMVECDDGDGIQQYQITHWKSQREIIFDKFSGEWMDSIKIRY